MSPSVYWSLIRSLSPQPDLKLADPICTYIFSVLVLVTTVKIMRDTVLIVLEGETLPVAVTMVTVVYLLSTCRLPAVYLRQASPDTWTLSESGRSC